MSFQNMLDVIPKELQSDIIEMDTFLKSLRPLKFKRTVDKRKINYVSSDYGVSYAILPLDTDPAQHFGWYYLNDKVTKTWYRKTDYLIETLEAIEGNDQQSAQRIFDGINECKICKGKPCSAISYVYKGVEKLACYGRVVIRLESDDFDDTKNFFRQLNLLVESKSE